MRGPSGFAHFYQQGQSDSLFSYELNIVADTSTFGLRSWDSPQASIPLEFYPTLQSIQLNLADNTLTGNCTVPTSSTNTSILPCLSGTFDPGAFLSLKITSLPFRNVSNQTVPSSTVMLRSEDDRWDVPSLILKEVDPNSNALQGTVLRTTIQKPTDCTQVKVCLSGTASGGPVGAEVLAPLGLVFIEQRDYASSCRPLPF